MASMKIRSLSLNLPFGLGGVQVEMSEAEVRAAWSLYVELATRVTAAPLEPGSGSVDEAVSSLYSLFAVTREVLRDAGPDVGRGPDSLGALTIRILNQGLRPFIVRWHTELSESGDRQLDRERREAFDSELAELRDGLDQYVDALASIAGVQ